MGVSNDSQYQVVMKCDVYIFYIKDVSTAHLALCSGLLTTNYLTYNATLFTLSVFHQLVVGGARLARLSTFTL